MPREMSYDQKSMMHGLSEVRAKYFMELFKWKLFFRHLIGIDVDVFSAPITEMTMSGKMRLVAVYKLSPWVCLEKLNEMFPGRAKFDQKIFRDLWSKRSWSDPLNFVWVPDRTALSMSDTDYRWTLEECLADELMYQFEMRVAGKINPTMPSLLGENHKGTVCQDTMFRDATRPEVYRGWNTGNYHINTLQPKLIPAETHFER